ncbi:MAG: energy transducer TonB [Acidobacteria bacterium]|nr:energy transducer TonB [Acidobacteriota bacterium]
MRSQDVPTPSVERALERRERREAGLNRPCLALSLTLHLVVLGAILFGPGLFAERTYLEPRTVELVQLATIRPKPIPVTPPPEEEPPPAPEPEPEPEPPPEEPPPDIPVLAEEKPEEPEPEPEPPPPPPEPEPEPRPKLERPFQRTRTVDDSLTGSDDAETPVVGYDSEDFTYAYYTTRLVAAIRARWTRPPIEGVEALVRFRIASDGTVTELELIESSGVARFDNAGLRAIELASPVPPLPVSFHKPSLGVTMRIR